jgi:hypothetical protein
MGFRTPNTSLHGDGANLRPQEVEAKIGGSGLAAYVISVIAFAIAAMCG